jgi:hypothetical protein
MLVLDSTLWLYEIVGVTSEICALLVIVSIPFVLFGGLV